MLAEINDITPVFIKTHGLVTFRNCGDRIVPAVYECFQHQQVDLALMQAEINVNTPVFIKMRRLVAFRNCRDGLTYINGLENKL